MESILEHREVRRALRWFADYARHLESAIPLFVEGGPDALWQERALELDVTLRGLDLDSLREAAFSDEGKKRTASLQRAQEGFESAIQGRLEELSDMMAKANRGQRGLLGYAEAGHLTRSSALYIERQL
jgi:hypothetical protein